MMKEEELLNNQNILDNYDKKQLHVNDKNEQLLIKEKE